MPNTTAISGKLRAAATRDVATIRSDAELTRATHELCALMAKDSLSPEEAKRFHDLVSSVEKYEETHYPIPEPSHAALLDHLLDARRISPAKLAKATRIDQRHIAAILNGERDIRATEAKAFSRYFRVDESVFNGSGPTVRFQVFTSSAGRAGFRVFGFFLAKTASAAQATYFARGLLNLATVPQSGQRALVPVESRFRLASL